MKQLWVCCFFCWSFFCAIIPLSAQNIKGLEQQLAKTEDKAEQMKLCYALSQQYNKAKDGVKTSEYALKAYNLALGLNNVAMKAYSAYMNGEGFLLRKSFLDANVRYGLALKHAKEAGEAGIQIDCLVKLADVASKNSNPAEAFKRANEAIDLLKKKNGAGSSVPTISVQSSGAATGGSDNVRIAQLEKDKSDLLKQIAILSNAQDKLGGERAKFAESQRELEKQRNDAEHTISEKNKAIESMSKEQLAAELRDQNRKRVEEELRFKTEKSTMQIKAQKLELLEKEGLLTKADAEIERSRYQMGILGAIALGILAIAGLFFARYRDKKKSTENLENKNKTIEKERQRSDELLLNILPANIAQELKQEGKAKARRYEKATVLFTDFKNFTQIAEKLSPEELVNELDYCFKAFDSIISHYGIEKIKTIGDAYMCASGLSEVSSNPSKMVKAALEIQEFLEEVKIERSAKGLPFFEARIGIHTGPVVAGVVGNKKFAYDIWGDTVNLAARMEQNCEPGGINISDVTYSDVRYEFDCQYRGKIAAKNKGEVEMYYVKGKAK